MNVDLLGHFESVAVELAPSGIAIQVHNEAHGDIRVVASAAGARRIAEALLCAADEIDRKSAAHEAQDAQAEADDYDLVLVNSDVNGNCYRYRRGKANGEYNLNFPVGPWVATGYKREHWSGSRLYKSFASMAAALKWWDESHAYAAQDVQAEGNGKSLALIEAEIARYKELFELFLDYRRKSLLDNK